MGNIADSELATGTRAGRGGPEERIMADLSRNVGFSQVDYRYMMSLDYLGCKLTDIQRKFAALIVETHPARPGSNEV